MQNRQFDRLDGLRQGLPWCVVGESCAVAEDAMMDENQLEDFLYYHIMDIANSCGLDKERKP